MSWASALDDFEAQIAAAEDALANGRSFSEDVLQPFEVPKGLGPFPTELHQRATAILDRNRRLTNALDAAMDDVEKSLISSSKEFAAVKAYAPTAVQNIPKYFDQPT